jgi:hypothetical protein
MSSKRQPLYWLLAIIVSPFISGCQHVAARKCDLKFSGFDLDLIGFEPDRLEDILAGLGPSGLTDPDSTPELSEHPVTQSGDIWHLGDHRIGCGDSTGAADVEPVLTGSRPDLMVADPP